MKRFHVVSVGVHEISHFIFFEQMHDWSKKTGLSLNDPSTHYFKEALTAAVMDQPGFRKFFDYPLLVGSENYPGNSELHQLFIEKNGTSESIATFFEKEILYSPDGYAAGIDRMLRRFVTAGNVFAA